MGAIMIFSNKERVVETHSIGVKMTETIVEPLKEPVSKPGCPQCGKEPRFCTKTGPVYRRKTKENPHTKVQAYVCTECGYKGRGNMFHMTEEMGKEKGASAENSQRLPEEHHGQT